MKNLNPGFSVRLGINNVCFTSSPICESEILPPLILTKTPINPITVTNPGIISDLSKHKASMISHQALWLNERQYPHQKEWDPVVLTGYWNNLITTWQPESEENTSYLISFDCTDWLWQRVIRPSGEGKIKGNWIPRVCCHYGQSCLQMLLAIYTPTTTL